MKLQVIKTEEEYKAAIKHLESMGDNPAFEDDSKLQNQYDLLSEMIESYENKNFHLDNGHPIEIIKLKMAYMGLKPKDLEKIIGSKGNVSEVLNKKRHLSKKWIRELSKLLKIAQELLNVTYELENKKVPKEFKKPIEKSISEMYNNIPDDMIHLVIQYQNRIKEQHSLFNICSI